MSTNPCVSAAPFPFVCVSKRSKELNKKCNRYIDSQLKYDARQELADWRVLEAEHQFECTKSAKGSIWNRDE